MKKKYEKPRLEREDDINNRVTFPVFTAIQNFVSTVLFLFGKNRDFDKEDGKRGGR